MSDDPGGLHDDRRPEPYIGIDPRVIHGERDGVTYISRNRAVGGRFTGGETDGQSRRAAPHLSGLSAGGGLEVVGMCAGFPLRTVPFGIRGLLVFGLDLAILRLERSCGYEAQ